MAARVLRSGIVVVLSLVGSAWSPLAAQPAAPATDVTIPFYSQPITLTVRPTSSATP